MMGTLCSWAWSSSSTTHLDLLLLSDATTVDKILSFEIPVVVSAIGDLIEFVQAIAKTLEDYWIGVGFQDHSALTVTVADPEALVAALPSE